MAGQSISAHADAATVKALKTIASREGRTTSQLMAASLRFYLGLPASMRSAIQDVEALGSPEEKHNLIRAMARTLSSAQYEIARRHLAENTGPANASADETAADILEEAIRLTRAG